MDIAESLGPEFFEGLEMKAKHKDFKVSKVSGEKVLARLEGHPELLARVERILDLTENTEGDVIRAADAEERAIRELDALGQEILRGWARRRAKAASDEAARNGSERYKKTAPLAKQLRKNRGRGDPPSRRAGPTGAPLF
jgi:hypothetical protein